jgi:hypothetical protein
MDYSADDIMTVAAARMLKNGTVCFVGIGLPSTAANLARLTHAPEVVLIYESGTIGSKPHVLPLSIGDGELATTADTVVLMLANLSTCAPPRMPTSIRRGCSQLLKISGTVMTASAVSASTPSPIDSGRVPGLAPRVPDS